MEIETIEIIQLIQTNKSKNKTQNRSSKKPLGQSATIRSLRFATVDAGE